MKICCVFSFKSPHRGDSNGYTQHTIINIKQKIIEIISSTIISSVMFFFFCGGGGGGVCVGGGGGEEGGLAGH